MLEGNQLISYDEAFTLVRRVACLSYRKARTLMHDIKHGTANALAIIKGEDERSSRYLSINHDGRWILC